MTSIRRINIYGGPGAGKSTASAYLFSQLKLKGYNVELVREYVKNWAYAKIPVRAWDQPYLFAKQLRSEEILLNNGVDIIITDSPIDLCVIYGNFYQNRGAVYLERLWRLFEAEYPSISIYLNRQDKAYNPLGRNESQETATKLDEAIRNHLRQRTLSSICESDYNNYEYMTQFILQHV